jgi:2-methylcitrate dehydratase PrpD
MAACLAQDGFTGARDIFTGPQGMAAGMSTDANPAQLVDRLGTRWAMAETSFKWHASCRHTHPSADALLQVMQQNGLDASAIAGITCHVHQGAIDVLGSVTNPTTVHQSKFSMGTVLALIARFGHAGLMEFDRHYAEPETVALRDKVRMEFDVEVDHAYPRRWIGKVTVHTTDGRVLQGRVDEPKGDPGNTLSREEIADKTLRLAAYGGTVSEGAVKRAVEQLWRIHEWPRVRALI